jgi:hypothetical protein
MDIASKIDELEHKYDDLVWYARANPDKPALPEIQEQRLQAMHQVETNHPRDVEALRRDPTNWQHGFNSGMLAAARLLSAYAKRKGAARQAAIEHAEEEFPMLDT